MKTRMYTSTLIIIITLLGIVSQQQVTVPNQEIVLQFAHDEANSDDALSTIATITKQLQDLGVDNILVNELEEGKLKITYYSNTDVAKIKRILSQEKNLQLGYALNDKNKKQSESPSDKNPTSYNLDVYEIQNINDADWNLDGFVLEPKTENDRSFNPDVNVCADIDTWEEDRLVKVAYKINRNIAIAIDYTSCNIPDVRAGPIS